MMKELVDLGLWSRKLKDNIVANGGSIQHIEGIPEKLKEKYKTVWEIPMRHLIDMAADRGAYVCQSQSLNLWVEDPDYKTLTSMHFHSWKKGLKTGIYYLRRKPKHHPQQFTIAPEEDNACEMCSG
jgi:ribonucleotide reductase alpha subunit